MQPERNERDVGESPSASAAAAIAPEDQARANLYGLMSRLFYAPADSRLLAEICQDEPGAETEGEVGGLVRAWRDLQDVCRSAFPALVKQEYDEVFVGVGRAAVTPYLSAYAEPAAPDQFLLRLRQHISRLGLSRRESVFEVEDHVSGISDVMRWLVQEGHAVHDQQQFFLGFLYPGATAFFAAVQKAPSSRFFKPVSAFALAFVEVEKTTLEMGD
jgi:TorA maturation chaperone TorD